MYDISRSAQSRQGPHRINNRGRNGRHRLVGIGADVEEFNMRSRARTQHADDSRLLRNETSPTSGARESLRDAPSENPHVGLWR